MTSNMYRDTTIEPNVARYLQSKWNKRVKALSKQTPYNEFELQCLFLIFHKFSETFIWWGKKLQKELMKDPKQRKIVQTKGDRLDRDGFRDFVFHFSGRSDPHSLDALFRIMDHNNKRYVTAASWIQVVSQLRSTEMYRALLVWKAYDIRGDGKITLNDMVMHAKKNFIDAGQEDYDGFCKEFVDTFLKDTTVSREGHMTLQDYLQIVQRRPLFREFLYPMFPTAEAGDAFLTTFSPWGRKTPKERNA